MRGSEIYPITKAISDETRLLSDPVRLIIPHLLNHSKNPKDFFILLELSKYPSDRNQILKIIKGNINIKEKLDKIIMKKSNKKIYKKIEFAIKNLKQYENKN